MRLLSTSLVAVLAITTLGACDSNAPESSADVPAANLITCSAPSSLSTTTIGGYIYITGLSSTGGTVEETPYQQNSWYKTGVAGTSDTMVKTDYPPYTGAYGAPVKTSFRARNICYDGSSKTFVFSALSSVITIVSDPL